MATRKRYTRAFKDESCKLVTEQNQDVAAAARGLGVAEQTLRYWLVHYLDRGSIEANEVMQSPRDLA